MSYLLPLAFAARLGHRDLHAALSLVSEAAATSDAQPFEHPTLESLIRMIPADWAGYFEYSNGGPVCGAGTTFFVEEPVGRGVLVPWSGETMRQAIASWPLRDIPAGLGHSALKLSDFLTGSRLRRNPWYCEVMRVEPLEHEMKVWLPAPAGTMRGFFFARGPGRDFDERESIGTEPPPTTSRCDQEAVGATAPSAAPHSPRGRGHRAGCARLDER